MMGRDFQEFPLWLSGLQIRLVSMRMQVRSLALLSGLRIWHFCGMWCRSQVQLRFDPLPRSLHMPQAWPYKAKKIKNKKKFPVHQKTLCA